MLIDILKALGLVLLINPAFTFLLTVVIITSCYDAVKGLFKK